MSAKIHIAPEITIAVTAEGGDPNLFRLRFTKGSTVWTVVRNHSKLEELHGKLKNQSHGVTISEFPSRGLLSGLLRKPKPEDERAKLVAVSLIS